MGYEVVEYTGFYGAPYLSRIPIANRAEATAVNAWLARRPVRDLTSYAFLLHPEKPPAASGRAAGLSGSARAGSPGAVQDDARSGSAPDCRSSPA